jgi:hypothetical protein
VPARCSGRLIPRRPQCSREALPDGAWSRGSSRRLCLREYACRSANSCIARSASCRARFPAPGDCSGIWRDAGGLDNLVVPSRRRTAGSTDPEERAAIVRTIFEMFASGNYGLVTISRFLEERAAFPPARAGSSGTTTGEPTGRGSVSCLRGSANHERGGCLSGFSYVVIPVDAVPATAAHLPHAQFVKAPARIALDDLRPPKL